MDLTWIWAAVAAVAAVATGVWSVIQAVQSRSPYTRYQQWMTIARDRADEPAVRRFADGRVRHCLVELASRSQVARVRRKEWTGVVAVFAVMAVPIIIGVRSEGFTTFMNYLAVATMLIGEIRVVWLRRKTYLGLYGKTASGNASTDVPDRAITPGSA